MSPPSLRPWLCVRKIETFSKSLFRLKLVHLHRRAQYDGVKRRPSIPLTGENVLNKVKRNSSPCRHRPGPVSWRSRKYKSYDGSFFTQSPLPPHLVVPVSRRTLLFSLVRHRKPDRTAEANGFPGPKPVRDFLFLLVHSTPCTRRLNDFKTEMPPC